MNANQLKALIEAITEAEKAPKRKAKRGPKGKTKLTKEEFELALVEACKKAGYASPEPRFNILTYNKWLEKGRVVKKGEHGLKVAGRKTRLFHEAQTETVPVAVAQVAQQATA